MSDEDVQAEVFSEAGDEHWLVHLWSGRHDLLSDAPEAEGGREVGPDPMTYVLAGLAACTSGTLRMFAEEHAIALQHVHVDARLVSEDGHVSRIERDLKLVGDLDQEDRDMLVRAAEGTPVTRLLRSGIDIHTNT